MVSDNGLCDVAVCDFSGSYGIVVCFMLQFVTSGTRFLAIWVCLAVQNGISSCDVSVCDISGLFDIAVCVMLCSIMSATGFFLAILDVLLSKTAAIPVMLWFGMLLIHVTWWFV